MAGSRRCLRLLLFGAVLCALHSTDAATTVSSPPMLRYYTVPITMPFNEGTLIQVLFPFPSRSGKSSLATMQVAGGQLTRACICCAEQHWTVDQ